MTRASVQTARLGLEAIKHGVVQLADGEFRAVLEISGGASMVDLDQRQETMLAGYSAFLNALSFPVQIVVRAAPVDLVRYISTMEERARQSPSGVLANLAHDHAAFVQSLARQRTLVERRYYLVVPAAPTSKGRWSGWPWSQSRSSHVRVAGADTAERQLGQRCAEVVHQLERCDLQVRRLSDIELAQLFVTCWSPERGRVQRFRQRLDDFGALAVRAAQRPVLAE